MKMVKSNTKSPFKIYADDTTSNTGSDKENTPYHSHTSKIAFILII